MKKNQQSKSMQTVQSSKQEYPAKVNNNLVKIKSSLVKAMNQIKDQQSVCRTLSFIKRISLDLNFQRMEQMLRDLEKGYIVLKHSPNTNEPHNKFIYISADHRFLCWKSFQKNDQKVIELRKIDCIIKDIFQSIVQSTTIKLYDRILIVNSQARSLELEFQSIQQKQKCFQQLNYALKNSKRMHLSYKL